jgi:hypothetical protein
MLIFKLGSRFIFYKKERRWLHAQEHIYIHSIIRLFIGSNNSMFFVFFFFFFLYIRIIIKYI